MSDADRFEASARELLRQIDPNAEREGLEDTPARMRRSFAELCDGYNRDPADILSTTFDMGDDPSGVSYGGIVLLRDIELFSLCEHHLLPFVGHAHVGYIPGEDGRVVGLSKLARLVECFARRLQCQERMTAQIADALETHLQAAGAIVVVEAAHMCMQMRGVSKQQSTMVTSEVRGVFEIDAAARSEALAMMGVTA